MESKISHESSIKQQTRKSISEIMAELTTPKKLLIQLSGWKNVCQALEYIFGHFRDFFDEISGISLNYDGLSHVVGNITSASNLKKKVLLGATIKLTTSFYDLDNERSAELLEGFDDIDRNLKKLSTWGCNFVILQVKLGFKKSFGARRVLFENSEYFGIFSATTQALGMVPIIQFLYDLHWSEEDCGSSFVDVMYTINQTLYDFDVDISSLLISQLVSYSLNAIRDNVIVKAETLINSLIQALPPAIGGVVIASTGSYKALGLEIDQISKIINRIPWPIICCYEWKIPTVLESDSQKLILERWVKKQRFITKVLLLALEGNLITWKGKLTTDIPDFITTHDYYDKQRAEAMLEPST